jgi:hypothetical protein
MKIIPLKLSKIRAQREVNEIMGFCGTGSQIKGKN